MPSGFSVFNWSNSTLMSVLHQSFFFCFPSSGSDSSLTYSSASFYNLSSTAIDQYTAAEYSTMPHLSELQPEKSISAIYKNSFSSCHSPALVSCIELLSSLWNAPSEMSILFFTLFIHWNCQPVFLIHVLCRSKVIHFDIIAYHIRLCLNFHD